MISTDTAFFREADLCLSCSTLKISSLRRQVREARLRAAPCTLVNAEISAPPLNQFGCHAYVMEIRGPVRKPFGPPKLVQVQDRDSDDEASRNPISSGQKGGHSEDVILWYLHLLHCELSDLFHTLLRRRSSVQQPLLCAVFFAFLSPWRRPLLFRYD